MSLKDEIKIIEELWQFKEFPFPDIPPINPDEVASFFINRTDDIQKAISTLFRGNNIQVKGTWGIGKTAFILKCLHRLFEDSQNSKKKIISIYIADFRGTTAFQFSQMIYKALKQSMQEMNLNDSMWSSIFGKKNKSQVSKAFHRVNWLGKEEEAPSPSTEIDKIISIAREKNIHFVIALDDLDKGENFHEIKNMLETSIDHLRKTQISFILTGRALTHLEDIELASLGIAESSFPLRSLDNESMKSLVLSQLNYVRKEKKEDLYPFTNDTVDEIINLSVGIPRGLNRICRKILEIAAQNNYELIDSENFAKCYERFQSDLNIVLPQKMKEILYYAKQRDGFLITSKEENFDDIFPLINKNASTVYDILPDLERLVRSDYLRKVEKDGEIRYLIAPGMEKAAEEGKKTAK